MSRSRASPDPSSPRARIAAEAARLLARDEAATPERARRKAALRLGIDRAELMPSETEVLQALRDYQRLFGENEMLPTLETLQQAANEALRHFAEFDPELCGALAEVPPRRDRHVHVLLYTDDPDAPLHRLLNDGLAHRVRRGSLHADGVGTLQIDHLAVTVANVDFLLSPLPRRCRALTLRSRADGEVLPRLNDSRVNAAAMRARRD